MKEDERDPGDRHRLIIAVPDIILLPILQNRLVDGDIAQLVEHPLSVRKVWGSTPHVSMFFRTTDPYFFFSNVCFWEAILFNAGLSLGRSTQDVKGGSLSSTYAL